MDPYMPFTLTHSLVHSKPSKASKNKPVNLAFLKMFCAKHCLLRLDHSTQILSPNSTEAREGADVCSILGEHIIITRIWRQLKQQQQKKMNPVSIFFL